MAMTNAERQAAWRQRQRERLEQLQRAERDVTPDAGLQAEVERLRARVAELEADEVPAKAPKRPPLASRVRVRQDGSTVEVEGRALWALLDALMREGKKNAANISGMAILQTAGLLEQFFSGKSEFAERAAKRHFEFVVEQEVERRLQAGTAAAVPAPTRAMHTPDGLPTPELHRLRLLIRDEVKTWPEVQQRRFRDMADKVDRLMQTTWLDYLAREHEEVAAELARLREARDSAHKEHMRYVTMVKGVKAQLTKDDHRRLLGVLHPDRLPSPEQRAAAFDIVKKLQPYIDAQG